MTLRPGGPGEATPAAAPNEQHEPHDDSWSFDPWSEQPVVAGVAALAVLAMWLIIAACHFPLI